MATPDAATKVMADDYLAAVHEAAHACYAQMRGWWVQEAVLHKVGARQDEQGHVTLHDWAAERDNDPAGFAIFLLIAGAAERRQTGTVLARCSVDYELAQHMCVTAVKDPTPDAVAKRMAAIEAIALATVDDPSFWEWVQRTSRALFRRRRLTGRDVHELREPR